MSKVNAGLFKTLGTLLGVGPGFNTKGMNPLTKVAAGATAMVGAPMLANMGVKGTKEAGRWATDADYWQARGYQEEVRNQEIIRMERKRRLDEAISRNTMMLANTDPQLFAELSAGRRLPKNAVPIGGTPRHDIIAEVARRMSTGEMGAASEGGVDALLQ